ncbi:tRNA A64-2'-O-ribosylphosphate transferase [Decorospora gaudefroyi]|uniref:tRNA A64-2'-O-ribosylphosphate transferase n=1 Tax=Decorospora gaudefroyi TaxID=184978 RepID=A0A6A5K813_9PLEO|nr:tRNA A64-2'-O-ribosylphosphate transferase [Decorospora gaudefroyi]
MSQSLKEADIIFPHLSNTPNLSNTLSSLRRSTLSTHNRLSSIISDSSFVTSVASAYDLPLVANERCGSWYIPPSHKSGSVYFKSTDGHMGEWAFSLRRLNLQLLDVVEKRSGAVVVDSTRRGKSMPDALSKTIPIWCSVINRTVFGKEENCLEEGMALFTPPQAVSESEHAQIEKRLDRFVRQFLDTCKPDIRSLRAKLRKPLRPIWVTQQSSLPDSPPSFPYFHPIILCTASRRVRGAEASEGGYIQGAADDHEVWSHGLTPACFWKHRYQLMSTSEEDAPSLIAKLLEEEKGSKPEATLVKPTTKLYISSSEHADIAGFAVVISCTPEPFLPSVLREAGIKHYLHLKCQTGKLGSRDLRTQLPLLLDFFSTIPPLSGHVIVCCPTGKDLSVGTALAILCLYTNDEGEITTNEAKKAQDINKALIKHRLSYITTSNPALNPSRSTLQSVNAVLLSTQDPKATLQPKLNTNTNTTFSPPTRPSKPVLQTLNASENVPSPDQSSVPSTIFEKLQSPPDTPWNFTRTLRSTLPTHPSGTVTGTATFTPCALATRTLLYAEEGEFVTDSGLKFSARRKYVYQLKQGDGDTELYIAVHFFDDEKVPRASIAEGVGRKGEGVGGLFVEMGAFGGPAERDGEIVWEAKNRETHLCAEDLYTASWTFGGDMVRIGKGKEKGGEVWWEVRYDVQGPKKDYVSTTRYTR